MRGVKTGSVVAIAIVLLMFSTAPAQAGLQRVDCESPAAYLEHNAKGFAAILEVAYAFAGSPDDPGITSAFGLTGGAWFSKVWAGLQIFDRYVGVGVSPQAIVNVPLGFLCLGIVDEPPTSQSTTTEPTTLRDAVYRRGGS